MEDRLKRRRQLIESVRQEIKKRKKVKKDMLLGRSNWAKTSVSVENIAEDLTQQANKLLYPSQK